MATKFQADDKLDPLGSIAEPGHVEWKRAKVEQGLAQSKDRVVMIPIEQVLRDLKA